MDDGQPRRATYQDVIDAPDDKVAEILDGVLYVQARPRPLHAIVGSMLGSELSSLFHRGRGGPGGWVMIFEPELFIGRDVLVPDFCAWRRERWPGLPEENGFRILPDFVCEVLSPSTARIDRTKKMRIYRDAGVPFLWLVDPKARVLEAYRSDAKAWQLLGAFACEGGLAIPPFEAVAIDFDAIFAEIPATPP